jgi:hypothetical protein
MGGSGEGVGEDVMVLIIILSYGMVVSSLAGELRAGGVVAERSQLHAVTVQ